MSRGNTRESLWTITVIILLVIGILFFFNWSSGRVVSEIPDRSQIGDSIKGSIFVPTEKISGKDLNVPAIISLNLEDEVMRVETTTFDKLLEKSSQAPKGHYIRIEDLLEYKFEKSGTYEFYLNAPAIDFSFSEKFKVD